VIKSSRGIASVVATALLVGAAAAGGVVWQAQRADAQALAAQAHSLDRLQAEVDALEKELAARPDWSVIAEGTEPSVFTVETDRPSARRGCSTLTHRIQI